jgi:hypothetical protein
MDTRNRRRLRSMGRRNPHTADWNSPSRQCLVSNDNPNRRWTVTAGSDASPRNVKEV